MFLIENASSRIFGISNLIIQPGFAPKNVILKPGINSIENDIWTAIKNHPLVIEKLENESLKIMVDGNDSNNESVNNSLASLHYTQANKIIKATFDLELLNAWQATETRAAVLRSIDQQIKQLEMKPAKETDENNEKFL